MKKTKTIEVRFIEFKVPTYKDKTHGEVICYHLQQDTRRLSFQAMDWKYVLDEEFKKAPKVFSSEEQGLKYLKKMEDPYERGILILLHPTIRKILTTEIPRS